MDESQYVYGTVGTPTTLELAHRLAEIEGGSNSVLAPSGLSAIALSLLALLRTGDHVLISDGAYAPTRTLCEGLLKRMGVSASYYDPMSHPMSGGGIAALMQANTRVVWAEAPSSITMEVPDLRALAAAAHAGGARLVLDNTWSAGWWLQPFDLGVDLSVQALTKYQGGHGDLLMGAVVARDPEMWREVRSTALQTGVCVAADEAWLVLRGLSTLGVRLAHVENVARELAQWLTTQSAVQRVLHPALASCPGHEHWRRDFKGSSGVFSFLLRDDFGEQSVRNMLNGMRVFKLGASWGGPVSLALPYRLPARRQHLPFAERGWLIRVNIGLEAIEDLREDLALGLTRLST